MNLIEQLGGYEAAKKHLDSCWCDDDNRAYLLDKLLAYRREHNIFEVGDYVVERDGETTDVLKVSLISDSLLVCENEYIHASYGLSKCKPCFYIKHATDEEIKAGKRL